MRKLIVVRRSGRHGHKTAAARCRSAVMDAELGADLIVVGVVDLLEDPQSLGPGPAGRGEIASAAVGVAEAVERVGLVGPVGILPGEVKGALVAGDGLRVVAELVVDV